MNDRLLAMKQRFDLRTFSVMASLALLGAIWAAYNLIGTGGERSEAQLRPLVWVYFAIPFALFLGWVIVRRSEVWRAAGICFCVYFFTPFVAARIESLLRTPEQAAATGHSMFFWAMIALHVLVALGLATWRAFDSREPLPVESGASFRPAEEKQAL